MGEAQEPQSVESGEGRHQSWGTPGRLERGGRTVSGEPGTWWTPKWGAHKGGTPGIPRTAGSLEKAGKPDRGEPQYTRDPQKPREGGRPKAQSGVKERRGTLKGFFCLNLGILGVNQNLLG